MRFNLYSWLRVPRTANLSTIRSAYRQAALVTHPDKGGSGCDFLATVEAFETLSDPERREAYDRQLQQRGLKDGLSVPGPLSSDGLPSAPSAAFSPSRPERSAKSPPPWQRGAATSASGGQGRRRAPQQPAAESRRQEPPQPAADGGAGPAADRGNRSASESRTQPAADDAPRGGDAGVGSLWAEVASCLDEQQQRRRAREFTFRTLVALLAWGESLRRRRREPRIEEAAAAAKRRLRPKLAEEASGAKGLCSDSSDLLALRDTGGGASSSTAGRKAEEVARAFSTAGKKAEAAEAAAEAKRPPAPAGAPEPPPPSPGAAGPAAAAAPESPPSLGAAGRGVKRRLRFRREAGAGAARRQRTESTAAPKSRGVHHAHGKSHQDYMASVGWHAFYISTLSTKSVAEAVDWHIDLVNLKQLAKQRIREGWGFDEAVQATVAETLAARKEVEGKNVPVLRFASFMSYQGKKISLPLADLDVALQQRAEMMALRRSGARLADIIAAKDRLVSQAKERRRQLSARSRAARLASRPARSARRPRAAVCVARVVKLLKEQLRLLQRRLRVHCLEPGLDAIQLHDGGPAPPEVYAYAELFESPLSPQAEGPARRALCTGPLRASAAEAAADRDALRRLQSGRGDEAACAEAARLDLEVMTARFMSVAQ